MAGKNKVVFSVRLDEEMYKKMLAVAEFNKVDVNNHILSLVRTNIAYHERVHGHIDTSKIPLDGAVTESKETK